MLRAIAHFAFIIYYSNYSFFMPGSRNFEERTGCFAVIPGEALAGFDCSLAGGSPVIINLAGGFLLGFLLRFNSVYLGNSGRGEREGVRGKGSLKASRGIKGHRGRRLAGFK